MNDLSDKQVELSERAGGDITEVMGRLFSLCENKEQKMTVAIAAVSMAGLFASYLMNGAERAESGIPDMLIDIAKTIRKTG